MLAVIDYGAGNLRSVLHALNHLQAENIRVVRTPRDLHGADKIILPGVGAFGAGMEKLREQDLVQGIRGAVLAGTPYLGICLGMQFLFEQSDEMGIHEGLGLIPGRVTRFENRPGLKVPHMGWNQLCPQQDSLLLKNLPETAYAYFVHSYYCVPDNRENVIVTINYGESFTAAVQHGNIYGVQFHPEKSQRTGLRILTNFLEL
jgi:imidazole glycerol-phosphate synthase subunit HisH